MGDDDLMLPDPTLPFGSGVIGVCDICGKRQAVVILEKERYQLCVLDFLNKSWKNSTALPGRPLPPYRSERCWFESSASPGVPAQGILLTPTKMVRRPGILVVSDLYGLTTMVLDAGVRLARVGFEVFLPDLGKIASIGITDQIGLRADVLLRGGVRLESPRVRRLVGLYADALEFLRHRPMVDPRKVGLFGASYGASLALGLAGRDAQISALALASPRPVSPPEFLRLLNAPVLLLVGGRDAAAARARRQIESARASVGFELELGGFPRAGPLFLARDATGYDLATAEGGWARTLAFLQGRLLPPPPKPPVPPVTRSLPPAVPAGAPPPPTTPRPGAA
ncbi:MAG: dienelactone hydrolase family protein, partial [Thermoplasmata archaeon]